MNPTVLHVDEGLDIEAIRRALAHVPEVQIVDMRAAQFVIVDAARAGDRIAELVKLNMQDAEAQSRFYRVETWPKEKQNMNASLASAVAISAGVPSMPGERDPFRRPERAPKPPIAIQEATKAKADAKRAARNAKRLANAGRAS